MWQAIKAVLAAFFGVRSRGKAARPIKPAHIIGAGLLCAVLLALLIWALVRHLVLQAV
ncbi:DUF2970 domain-containing protein [Chitinibacter sp. S2-10]|uniref:DUF2970 domain-containing protein n=1 Tax=Chitinibacter sp. S2-10 TaxID=3373597 RepID=UPI0039772E5B